MIIDSLRYGDCLVRENAIDQYRTNDLAFREEITEGQYAALKRFDIEDIETEEIYSQITATLPTVIFIDMTDVYKYVKINSTHSLDNADISTLISLVADELGDESQLHSVIWEHFTDDLTSQLSAKLGVDENDILTGDAFNLAMENLYSIASIIVNYLVNVNVILINACSIYGYFQERNGVVAFKLRTFKELHDIHEPSPELDLKSLTMPKPV